MIQGEFLEILWTNFIHLELLVLFVVTVILFFSLIDHEPKSKKCPQCKQPTDFSPELDSYDTRGRSYYCPICKIKF